MQRGSLRTEQQKTEPWSSFAGAVFATPIGIAVLQLQPKVAQIRVHNNLPTRN